MAKPIGPAWRSLSWKVEPGHALAEGRDDRVVVRLIRPRVGGGTLALLFQAQPEVSCVTVAFEAEGTFDANMSAALRAPVAALMEDAAVHAEAWFAEQGGAAAEGGLEANLELLLEADRLARLGVVEADVVALRMFALYRSASKAASTRSRPVAWMGERLECDRATVHRWVARGRELCGADVDEVPDEVVADRIDRTLTSYLTWDGSDDEVMARRDAVAMETTSSLDLDDGPSFKKREGPLTEDEENAVWELIMDEEDENAGGSRLARIQQLEREMEGESDAREP